MLIDDPLLPAAAHLTGPDAADVLRPVVDAAGGQLLTCRTSQVQYRPESDLVVRYRCSIRRNDVDTNDTLLAATTTDGPFAGTVPIEAQTIDGTKLTVGVWRWPFDPILTDLATMVTPHRAAEHLHDLVGEQPMLEVVAYRPTERAVVRVSGDARDLYVKVLPAASVAALVARHDALADAGLPVPRVVRTGTGWVAMEALSGTTLRDRLKQGDGALPPPATYSSLLAALADTELAAAPVRSRLDDAVHHAAMLATVVPDARERLDEIVERLRPASTSRTAGTVHGDLHEGQLVVDDARVIGLLDIDDVGPGDLLDDVGVLIGHLQFRAMTSGDERIGAYASAVRDEITAEHDSTSVERHVAAVLVGLATGPFRIQQPGWATTTDQVLRLIERHLDAADHSAPVVTSA